MKILFLSYWFPFPPNNGSKLRISNLIRGLAKDHEITLISFSDQVEQDKCRSELDSIFKNVHIIPKKSFDTKSLKARTGYFGLTPRSIIDTYSEEMAQRIRKVIGTQNPEVIIASQIGTAVYHKSFIEVPAIFEELEVGLLYEKYSTAKIRVEKFRNGLTWWKHRLYLSGLLKHFQACTVVSEKEKDLLQPISPRAHIEVIPNCIESSKYLQVIETPQPDTLIFTGSFKYYPNYEAVMWFLDKVYPLVKARMPAMKLIITGDSDGRRFPGSGDIIQTGLVDDVRPLIAKSWISIVPILSGGGTRLKILEAMALQTPVVTTSKGAEGLQVNHGADILIADTPDEFAASILKLTQDPGLRTKLARNAFDLVKSKYDWRVIFPHFNRLVEDVKEHRVIQ